jgi:hypothetical protein
VGVIRLIKEVEATYYLIGGVSVNKKLMKKLKKILLGILVLILIGVKCLPVFAADINITSKFSGGEGTKDNPYLISSIQDLTNLSDTYSKDHTLREACFMLTKNIDLKKIVWNPIGSQKYSFSGTFDGNGKSVTIRNVASGNILGLFGMADSHSKIRNLTVNGVISKKITSKEGVYFGLIAGRAEGVIENCITEGEISLTVNASQDVYFGATIGIGSGSVRNIQNNASITLKKTGKGFTFLGGIAGSTRGTLNPLSEATNTGSIDANVTGVIMTGGIAGEYADSRDLYSAKNEGNITVVTRMTGSSGRSATGGIVGMIIESGIDRALNQGKVLMSCTEAANEAEIMAGGIAGNAEDSQLANVGNEGMVEVKGNKVSYAAGIIGNVGRKVILENAYNKGKVYGTSPVKNSELYISGMVSGIAVVNNFYNSGSVRLKAINMSEIDGEAFTNIRPGENTKTFNYCYWNTGMLPFPLLQKGQVTTSEFNPANGKLSRNVTISRKKYGNITVALNAWVNSQKSGYVKWTGKKTPAFQDSFGYIVGSNLKSGD